MIKLCHSLRASKRLKISWQLPSSINPVRSFSLGGSPRTDSASSGLKKVDSTAVEQYLESILFSRKTPSEQTPEQSNVSEDPEKIEDVEAKKKDEDEKDEDKKDKDDEDEDDDDDDDHDHKGSILIPLLNLLKI